MSDAPEERLDELAADVEKRFLALKKGSTRGDQDFMIMFMVAVSILDDLKRVTQRYKNLSESSKSFVSDLIGKIDELLTQNITDRV
jgi:cell division protein ZapA (FtsZ GTPase activity inhibitor)